MIKVYFSTVRFAVFCMVNNLDSRLNARWSSKEMRGHRLRVSLHKLLSNRVCIYRIDFSGQSRWQSVCIRDFRVYPLTVYWAMTT